MIKVKGLTHTFNKRSTNEKTAINNLSLNVDDGEFITIIGGNGAGKSTLLNCIAGVYEPDSGSIVIDDDDVTFWPEYKRSRFIGRVFQNPLLGTAFAMTIEENLAMAYTKGKIHGLQPGLRRNERELFRERLAQLELGLEDRMTQKVGLLSGGQRQALTLLMATIVRPKLLMLDEHTAALDPPTARKVLQLTRELVAEHNLSTLMVTHNMKAALEYGNRTIMMHDGRIILDIDGESRDGLTVDKLIEQFNLQSGEELDNDRLLLS